MYAAKQQQELQSAHRVVRGEDIHDVAARDELVLHRTVAGPDEHRARSWRSTTQPAMATEAIAMLLSVHRTAGGRTAYGTGAGTTDTCCVHCALSQ